LYSGNMETCSYPWHAFLIQMMMMNHLFFVTA
jgi:hypothetical protein